LQTIQKQELNYNVLIIDYKPTLQNIDKFNYVQQKFIDFIIDESEKYCNLITGILYEVPTEKEYIK
jgi:hypothetical protein